MKQMYRNPEMDVIYFEVEDVITTSYPTTGTTVPGTTSGGMINGGAGGDVGSGDSGKFEDLFPGLVP